MHKRYTHNRYMLTGQYTRSALKKIHIPLLIFLAVPGLRCCVGFSLVVASGGYSSAVMSCFLVAVASLAAEHGALRVRGLQ